MLEKGNPAPDFTFADAQGTLHTLAGFNGRKVILYFYPRDDTPGCTTEACSFRDAHEDLLEAGAAVIGVSPDTEASHARFRAKYDLPFHLVPDVDHAIAEAYGVWGEKKNYGKTYMGILRTTFLIDEAGDIVKVWPKVSPDGHGPEVLDILRMTGAMPNE